MNEKQLTTLSKLMSLALRHQPDVLGITLDENGWTSVESLLKGMASKGHKMSVQDLEEVVENNNKKRFAFSEDKLRIRASQGHSVEVDLQLEPAVPPEFLYHGTAIDNVASIRKNGIEKRARHHVHLSPDKETALKVGIRHGKPEILNILSGKMHTAGYLFYCSANGVWLTDFVPAEFIGK